MFYKKLLAFAVLLTALSTLICAAQLDKVASLPSPVEGTNVAPVVAPAPKDVEVEKKTTSTTTTTTTTTTSTPSTTTTTTTSTSTTTTTPPPDTTTPSTTSTTAAPITTTPKPAPYPKPAIGYWNSSCLMVQMAIQLNFTYQTKDNKTATTLYNIPKDAKVEDSHCASNTTQNMQINWGDANAQHSMVLQFDLKEKNTVLSMMYFVLNLTPADVPDVKENQTIQLIHRGSDFDAPISMSYHCTRPQTFNLTEVLSSKTITGTVTVEQVQTEAFHKGNNTNFAVARDCDSSNTPDVVPIAVGIALALLIIIVLISYLCARRRSTSRGYMSF